MSETILYPVSDASVVFTPYPASPTTHYDKIDESGTHDGNSTYVYKSVTAGEDLFNLTDWSDTGDTINSVEVLMVCKKNGTAGSKMQPFLVLGSNSVYGTDNALTIDTWIEYRETLTRPGGGSWTEADLDDLQVGIKATPGKNSNGYCTQLQVIVTHTGASNHPSPINVEIDKQTPPVSNVGEHFTVSAVWQATGGSGTATHASVEVASDSGFTSFMWQSGWIDIADISHGTRCELIVYAGTYLSDNPPNDYYWIRIKFKDGSAVESDWSTGVTAAPVFERMWHDANSPFRHELTWETPHLAMAANDIQKFEVKTGNRIITARNGDFNESVQASGGFQVDYHDGKTHKVYLSEIGDDNELGIYIVTKDHQSGTWGEPVKIDGSGTDFDTHFFPVLCFDKLGYIHVFYGCHYSSIYHARSTLPNDSSAWQLKGAVPRTSWASYPVAFLVDDGTLPGQVFLLFRYGSATTRYTYKFIHTDPNPEGDGWGAVRTFMQDTSADKYILYVYGIRFNEAIKRLFISYTFVWGTAVDQDPMDISCAYCDWENTGYYFNDWYYMDGASAGTTESDPIDYNAAKAIMLSHQPTRSQSQDHRCAVFTETLELDTTGNPIVFFELKWYEGSATEETYLACARWNPGVPGYWIIEYISDQVNMMLRVRRSSVAVQKDKNGIIQLLMPVAAKTYHHMEAAADVDDVDITQSESGDNFALIADGISLAGDNEQTYIDLGATTGKASFTAASAQNIRADATILGVEVEYIAKYVSGSGSVKPYLDDGTEYDGTAETLTSAFDIYRYMWLENPADSSGWTPADINSQALAFGLKNNAATAVRITKVIMRVYYTLATDKKHASTELWLLSSSDNGATWQKVKEVSRNSVIGVPIMNHMHHLRNNQIGFIWCSGKHLFMYTDEPYGLMQDSGIDIKLYYGDSQIDRVLDYPNLNESTIRFKLPEALAADKARAPKALFMYYGNKNTTAQPLGDPDNVYKGWYNAEDYIDGDTINGTDGWTAVSGTWTAYTSPPNHANKVAGGEGAYMVDSAAGILSRSLGTDLTNLFISCYIWNNTGGSTQGIRIYDGSTYFEAGVDGNNTCIYYNNNGTVVNTAIKAKAGNYHKIAIQVTDKGCSVFVGENETVAVRELASSLVQVDTLDLRTGSAINAFFDLLTISTKVERSTAYSDVAITDCLAGGDSHGPTADYVSNNESCMMSVVDGHYNISSSYDRINRVDVKMYVDAREVSDIGASQQTHSLRCWLVGDAPYPDSLYYEPYTYPEDVIGYIDFVIYTTGQVLSDGTVWIGGVQKDFVSFTNLPEGTKSLKVDFYASTYNGAGVVDSYIKGVYWWDVDKVDPVITIGSLESNRGWVSDAVLKGASEDQWVSDAVISGDYIDASYTMPVMLQSKNNVYRTLPFALRNQIAADRTLSLLSSRLFQADGYMPFIIACDLSADRELPFIYGNNTDSMHMLPLMITGQTALDAQYELSFILRSALSILREHPFIHLNKVQSARSIPMLINNRIIGYSSVPFIIKEGLSIMHELPFLQSSAVMHAQILPYISMIGTISDRHIPITFQQSIISHRHLPLVMLHYASIARIFPMQITQLLFHTQILCFELLQKIIIDKELPIISTIEGMMQIDRILSFIIQGSVQAARIIPFETIAKITSDRILPINSVVAVDINRTLPVNILNGIHAMAKVMFHILGSIGASARIELNIKSSIVRSVRINFIFNEGFTGMADIPFTLLEKITADRMCPYSIIGILLLAAAIKDARIYVPEAKQLSMLIPDILNPVISINDVTYNLSRPDIDTPIIIIPGIDNINLFGEGE